MPVPTATLPELYRDPVYDGATDPLVVIAPATESAPRTWWMFYTQRRATHADPGPGVAWVHGSRIGVAQSSDGLDWTYAGTLEPVGGAPGAGAAGSAAAAGPEGADLVLEPGRPPADVDRTHWAPEVIHDGTQWRMYLTEIDGIPDRWPGFARHIVEYASDDLAHWTRRGPLPLDSDRVIDAGVARFPDGAWRLFYKDEAAESVTKVAVSDDLTTWRSGGTAIGGRGHEGPCPFELGGWWWLVVDEWRGMGVYRSADGIAWERQGDEDAVILAAGDVPGHGNGHHGAAVRDGDRTWFYFFGHPARADGDRESVEGRTSPVYRVELVVDAGILRVV